MFPYFNDGPGDSRWAFSFPAAGTERGALNGKVWRVADAPRSRRWCADCDQYPGVEDCGSSRNEAIWNVAHRATGVPHTSGSVG